MKKGLVFILILAAILAAGCDSKKSSNPINSVILTILNNSGSNTIFLGETKKLTLIVKGSTSIPRVEIGPNEGTVSLSSVSAEKYEISYTPTKIGQYGIKAFLGSSSSLTFKINVIDPVTESGFSWLKFFNPGGVVNSPKIVNTGNGYVVGMNVDDKIALVAFDEKGNQSNMWKSKFSAKLNGITFGSGKIVITGVKGDKALLQIFPTSLSEKDMVDASFQVEGEPSEGKDVAVRGDKIFVAVHSDWNYEWTEKGKEYSASGNFVMVFDFDGTLTNGWTSAKFEKNSGCTGEISSIFAPKTLSALYFSGYKKCGDDKGNFVSEIAINDFTTDNYYLYQSNVLGEGNFSKIIYAESDNYSLTRVIVGTTISEKIHLSGYTEATEVYLRYGPMNFLGVFESMVLDQDTVGALMVGQAPSTADPSKMVGGVVSIGLKGKENTPPGEIRWGKKFENLPLGWQIPLFSDVAYATKEDDGTRILVVGVGSDGVNENMLVIGKSRYPYVTSSDDPIFK